MQQVVLPIKDSNVLKEVQDTLLNNFKAGRRNYTVLVRLTKLIKKLLNNWIKS
ncbi:hypothetical protein ACFP1L_14495 [Lactiplantibacillus nangangensis]|uniref:Uncharacterized protein n=1 Tax=Lactiplantibacillus nangangensis TaxID=2559917 RepID=A0ABW1SP54_9LACO|nr:hypothetical protein [Lactiplantibacillus plantarum]